MLLQIIMIWGAAQAALFSFPSQAHAGEWENYQDLKAAIVRSSARRDVPLPPWAVSLDYKRSHHFWDVSSEKKNNASNLQNTSPVVSSAVPPVVQESR